MFKKMFEEFGTIDILVNNAGLQQDAALEDMTLQQWNTVISINLTGQWLCAREAAKEFKRRGVKPEVSVAAGQDHLHELGARRDSVGRPRQLRVVQGRHHADDEEHGAGTARPTGFAFTAFVPGAIRTPINTEAWTTPEAYNDLMKLVPYNRIGEPEDIANVTVMLASDLADYVNGINVYVDGGMTLYPGFEAGG